MRLILYNSALFEFVYWCFLQELLTNNGREIVGCYIVSCVTVSEGEHLVTNYTAMFDHERTHDAWKLTRQSQYTKPQISFVVQEVDED